MVLHATIFREHTRVRNMKKQRLVTALGVLAALIALGATAAVRTTTRPPSQASAAGSGLVDQRGSPFALDQLRGKTVVLNFIFTHCPGICPTQTAALHRVQQGLPDAVRARVHFTSVSIDPERDTPAALMAFAQQHRLDLDHWTFVTGTRQELAALAQLYSAEALAPGADPLGHRSEVRVLDAEGRLVQTYTGVPLDETRLTRELQTVDRLFTKHAD